VEDPKRAATWKESTAFDPETWARIGAPQVRVNEIMLGFVETRGWGLLTEEQKQSIIDHTLLE